MPFAIDLLAGREEPPLTREEISFPESVARFESRRWGRAVAI